MIELVIKAHLEEKLDVPVYFEFPSKTPQQFVVVKAETNPRENMLDSAMLVVDSYGPSQLETMRLNAKVKTALDDLVQLTSISSSKRGGDYPAFDTIRKRYRYQAVQNITFYEE